jgi:sec-independent protein translocase protein TatB
MFDFSFPELLVVFVVALVVLGPTRLPGLVRKLGRWIGKARSMAREFRDQLEQEVNVEELNRSVRRTVMDEPPPPPAAAASTTAQAGEPLDSSGYPYGASSSSSADPAVTGAAEPQPGDDTFSHAHAPDAAPEPWHPDPAPAADEGQGAAIADATGADDPAHRGHNA